MSIVRRFAGLLLLGPLLLLGIAGLSGCAHQIPISGNIESMPVVTRLPVAVGVYYSPEFKVYKYEASRYGDIWIYPIGTASVEMFDRLFPVLFETSLSVDRRPPMPPGPFNNLDGVIEVRFDTFEFALPLIKNGNYTAEVGYRVILYAPNGEVLFSQIIKGFGSIQGQFGFGFTRWPGEAASLAVQDAGTRFLKSFGDAPEVRQWLNRLGK